MVAQSRTIYLTGACHLVAATSLLPILTNPTFSSTLRYPSPTWQGLARLEELVRKIRDLVDNRVEANLAAVSRTLLVDLPSDRSFTAEEFVASQAKFLRKQGDMLAIRCGSSPIPADRFVRFFGSASTPLWAVVMRSSALWSMPHVSTRRLQSACRPACKPQVQCMPTFGLLCLPALCCRQ